MILRSRIDRNTFLIVGVVLLAVSQTLEDRSCSVAEFLRGLLVGLSIVSGVVGLFQSGQANKE